MSETTDYGTSNTGANEESLRMVSSQPIGNEPVSDEEYSKLNLSEAL